MPNCVVVPKADECTASCFGDRFVFASEVLIDGTAGGFSTDAAQGPDQVRQTGVVGLLDDFEQCIFDRRTLVREDGRQHGNQVILATQENTHEVVMPGFRAFTFERINNRLSDLFVAGINALQHGKREIGSVLATEDSHCRMQLTKIASRTLSLADL